MPVLHDHKQVLSRAEVMLQCATAMNVPMLVTEQYPKGLGRTVKQIMSLAGDAPIFEKSRFSGITSEVEAALNRVGRKQVLVMGTEAHVCVMQSVLDLLRRDYEVGLLIDAVASRSVLDRDTAIRRMLDSGALGMTVESAVFEMVEDAADPVFKNVRGFIK